MRTFGKLNPRLSKDSRTYVGRKKRSYIENLYFDAINYAREVPTEVLPRIRPSSFPMCSIKIWRKLIEFASTGTYIEKQEASGKFFTSVGTIAHEVFQYYMGTHQVVYGNWKCINSRCEKSKGDEHTRVNTTKNKCPCCKEPMRYEEVEVFYNGIYAHIDCLIKLPKSQGGGWWVLDYKTATKYICDKLKRPKVAHTYQVPAYVYMLKKVLNLDIKGYSLLYISRDNPFKYKSLEYEWTDKEEKRISKILKNEKRKFHASLKSLTTRNMDYIVDVKPCKNQEDYDAFEFYSTCEFLDVCFERPLLDNRLLELQKQYPYTKKAAKQLRLTVKAQELEKH